MRRLFLTIILATAAVLAGCEKPDPAKNNTEQGENGEGSGEQGGNGQGQGGEEPGGQTDPLAGVGKDYKDFDIFLAIGQSNMAGRGPLEEADRDSITGVWILNPARAAS